MNGASKILTVSYGTFSCTLEGFNDPFNTMKAIAEYFRDLAAEDRYFGAEPPQPDAAMLHRIAEREIQRRVEAKVQENGVILRAEDGEGLPAPAKAASAMPAQQSAPQPSVQPSVQIPARGMMPAPRPAPSVSDLTEPASESVAEKLSRLRKAAAEQASPAETVLVLTDAPLGVADSAASDEFIEDQHADAPATAPIMAEAPRNDLPEVTAPMDEILPEAAAPSAAMIETEDLPPEQQNTADEDSADAGFDPAEMAAMLALDGATETDLEAMDEDEDGDDLILANLALAAASDPVEAPEPVDQTAQEQVDENADADAQILAKLGALIDPDLDEEEAPAAPADMDEAEADEPAAAQGSDQNANDGAFANDTAWADFSPAETTEPEPEPASNITLSEAPAEPAFVATVTEEAPARPVRPVRKVRSLRPAASLSEADALSAPASPVSSVDEALAETESRTPITVEKLQRARARVIKIRRHDGAAPVPAAPVSASAASALSPEAEAALAAELRALQEESPAPEPAAPAPAPTAKAELAAQSRFGQTSEDQAVNRLMAEASTKMEVPDTKRRMSAIAHLKAAVAATLAERRATGSTLSNGASAKISEYREDLAKVMRPASPAAPAAATDRTERPAPLVLVSEQRIDRPAVAQPRPVQPARPQRAAQAMTATLTAAPALDDDLELEDEALNIFDGETAFPDFAERLGARDLPDLLEAAAAYIACVEGRDSFTRPQLMRHLGAAAGDVSREDGLRSFGVLLRDGVFERSRRGQFAIHEGSALLAEAKKIARA